MMLLAFFGTGKGLPFLYYVLVFVCGMVAGVIFATLAQKENQRLQPDTSRGNNCNQTQFTQEPSHE